MRAARTFLLAALFILGGCARLPNGGAIPFTKRLVISFTLQNPVNPAFVYLVALRPSNSAHPTDQGPIPVIAPPWGNGFVAGNVNFFVRWDANQPPSARYTIYQFQDVNLINFFASGVPINFMDSPDERTLKFELDLSQIAPDLDTANAYQSVQVNFLTMDRVPQGSDTSPKTWDALGDGRIASQINTWVTIPLRTSTTYSNSTFNYIEPAGDVADPSLDIIDWSVQVIGQ